MTGANHVVGGVVFTGVFGAIIGFNVLSSPFYIGLTVFASLFPDIDHTKSLIGKAFYPIAKIIDRKYGHRTITHSLLALIVTTIVVQFIQSAFFQDSNITYIWILGFVSHLIYDMVTLQGVPLFYPFMRNACVVPANPSSRMRTNDMRAEARVFGIFVIAMIAFKPLVEQGFWTSYNRLFGTMKHLTSEYHKAGDLLQVDYTYRIASDVFKGSGYVVQCTENKAALIQDARWMILDKSKMVIDEVIPTHTGLNYGIEKVQFVSIDADSLNQILKDRKLVSWEFESNGKFMMYDEGVQKELTRSKGQYESDLFIAVEESKYDLEPGEEVKYVRNPKRGVLERKIKKMEREYSRSMKRYRDAVSEVASIKSRYEGLTDLYEREMALKEIKELEKVKEPSDISFEVQEIKLEIKELRAEDYRILDEKKRLQKQMLKEGRPKDVHLSGHIEYFEIRDSSRAS